VNVTLLLAMAGAGFVGSVHCVGMCGGLIAVASDGVTEGRGRVAVQLGYQGGRLASYLVLGAVAGALGRALDFAGQAAGFGKTAALVAGVSMTLGGLWAMLEAGGAKLRLNLPRLGLPAGVTSFLARAHSRAPVARAGMLGGASAFLPCGFLYAFALAAAATGSAATGALVMAALWVGNLPALLGFGLAIGGVLARVKAHVPLLSATSVFVLGLLTLTDRVNLPAFAASGMLGTGSPHAAAAAPPTAGDCPCHRKHEP
jgi:sulfite exporter TauE/SafE